MRKLNWCSVPVIVLALAIATAACGRTVGETIDDTTITTRVKTAMLNDPTVGGLRIDVDTFKGVVTLSGRVKSQAEKDQADCAGAADRRGCRSQGRAADHSGPITFPSSPS